MHATALLGFVALIHNRNRTFRSGRFDLANSVWPFRSEPFRSRDFLVLVVLVPRHFGQTMKPCINLTCSLV